MTALGIDLGTTNSLAAVYEEAGPRLIRNALGSVLTPSAVSLANDGSILVGASAKDRLISHPEHSVAAFKRLMGTSRITKLGRRSFRPEELSALILRALVADVAADLGKVPQEAVISVPAYFNDHQRKATIDAGRLAGLKVDRLVNEPTAAALAYGIGQEGDGTYLVFDLGGGTFDVSILEKYEDILEVRATAGDTRLGGDDFSGVIADLIARKSGLAPDKLASVNKAKLVRQAENLKLELSRSPSADYRLPIGNESHEGTITRQAFEEHCAPLLQRLRLPTERAIRDAGLSLNQFTSIVMVGGATRMPMIRSLVARLFGQLPLVSIDPDTTVALGAAVQAGLVARGGALRDVVLTDVCPFTLGIETIDDPDSPGGPSHISPLIERNAVVPISRTTVVSTVQDRQHLLSVQVYQGENLRPQNNVHLGTIDVPVPSGPRGKEAVEVRFTYDVNGALQVEATSLSNMRKHSKIFRNALGLTEKELHKHFDNLQEIKLFPRERMENKALIARAERLYEESRGLEREHIKQMLLQFEADIQDQKLRDADSLRSRFASQLDGFEKGSPGHPGA
jgi:molecular chaperone HscC